MDKTNDEYCMYIFVNSDLNMSTGKIVAQAAHVVEKLVNRINRMLYEDYDSAPEFQITYKKYLDSGHKKVTLKASYEELLALKNDLDAEFIIDEGITEVPPNSLTVVGFLPTNDKNKFKKFRLY